MDGPKLQALTWIAPGHELAALTEVPATCFAAPGASHVGEAFAGSALFNAPQLLGGQAARAGVSCASCHSNGRRNPHFFLAGVSSAPGTADVSSSFFSPARGNATFDPKPIPDLALPGKVSRDPANGELERFLRGLIVEEFAGREPSRATLVALAAYIRTIRPCDDPPPVDPLTVERQVAVARDAAVFAAYLAANGEPDAASVLVSSARHHLGLIHERFRDPGLAPERRLLLKASRALQPAAQASAPDVDKLHAWVADFDRRIAPRLVRAETRSLYNPARLARFLGR